MRKSTLFTIKHISAFLLILNLAIAVAVFLIEGRTPFVSLIGALFSAASLSIADNRDKNEED
jgi:hypothetical protein